MTTFYVQTRHVAPWELPMTSSILSTARLGLWSGVLCALLSVAFVALMVLDVLHIYGGTLQLVPVLLLPPCLIALAAAVHEAAPADRKVWALTGLGLSIPYGVIVSLNYMLQLTVVHTAPQKFAWMAMSFAPDSTFGVLELLGYGWQALALLAMAAVFRGRMGDGVVRWIFIVNAVLALVGTVLYITTGNPMHPAVLLSLGFWCVGFPVAMVLLGVRLWRSLTG
jgi:hypothetical protein